jgi:hypothetical protein
MPIVITQIISMLPLLIKVFRKVKELDEDHKKVTLPKDTLLASLSKPELNKHKQNTVVEFVYDVASALLERWNWDDDDVRTLVNFAVTILKKVRKRNG